MKPLILIFLLMIFFACNNRAMTPAEGERQAELSAKGEEGQKVFMEYCNKCHPGGQAGLGPGIIDKPAPGAIIKVQVRNGLGTMPAFSKEEISEEELDALVEYLREMRTPGDDE